VVPHLLQNFAPVSKVAPQELQNAIKFASHPLILALRIFALTAEYIASSASGALPFFAVFASLAVKSFLTAKGAKEARFLKQPGGVVRQA
jgi:hypothetical protein